MFNNGVDVVFGAAGPAGRAPDPRAWEVMTGYGWGPDQVQAYTDRPANVALDGAGRLVDGR